MVSEETTQSIVDPTKTLHTVRSHRAPGGNYIRPVALLLLLAIASPFLVTSVLPKAAPVTPLSEPYTAETYAPLTFPYPPYIEPTESRTADAQSERVSRSAKTEQAQPSKVEIVISFAMSQRGKRYVFGTKGPNTYDCSGLLVAAFARIGINLYHYTGEQIKEGRRVARSDLQRGDIVFPSYNHVGIYLGGNEFIHASSGQGKVVVAKIPSVFTARRLV